MLWRVQKCTVFSCAQMGGREAGIPCDDAAYRLQSATIQRYKAPLQILLCAVLVYAKVRKEKRWAYIQQADAPKDRHPGHRPRKDAKAARQGPRRACIHSPRSLVLNLTCSAYFFNRNSVFLSQQFSRNSVFSQSSDQRTGPYMIHHPRP